MKFTTEQPEHAPVSSIRTEPFSLPAGTHVIDDSLETIEGLYEYNHWIYNQLRPFLGQDVLEVGSGTGNITQFLAMNARKVKGVEPVTSFVERFNDRLGHMSHVSCTHGYLQDLPEPAYEEQQFDTVVSCNVLEHIEDDVSALGSMMSQVRSGGRVLIFVPAGPMAFGRLDRELGHYRRYSKRSLRAAMTGAGLEWEYGRYSNALGLLGWFVNSVLLRKKHVPSRQAKFFDRLVPFISAIERLLPLPMGQSVLGVGRKPLKHSMVLDVRNVGRKAA